MMKIKGVVQHYDWGGENYIPQLLNIENTDNATYAEYWLGAHANASSVTNDGSLVHLINDNKDDYLGKNIADKFGRLPFLFKILDVKKTLSIQVHPSKTEAEKGFARENEEGIAINAFNRNYKDDNHKPEMMIALSDFYLLHGFKEEENLEAMLSNNTELRECRNIFENEGYKGLYSYVMNIPQAQVNEMLQPILEKEYLKKQHGQLEPTDEGWWFIKWYEENEKPENIDRGIFSVYFFNVVKLNIGESIFQAAGLPHAYLQGQCVEIMANSDNVLRGGLTTKYIDVAELLKHTVFNGIAPHVILGHAVNENEKTFASQAEEFTLSAIQLQADETYSHTSLTPEILFCISGNIIAGNETLKKGEALFIKYNESYRLKATEDTVLYKGYVNV